MNPLIVNTKSFMHSLECDLFQGPNAQASEPAAVGLHAGPEPKPRERVSAGAGPPARHCVRPPGRAAAMAETAAPPPPAVSAAGLPAAPGSNPLSRKLNKILETRLDNDKVRASGCGRKAGVGSGPDSGLGPARRGAPCGNRPDEPSESASPDRLRNWAASPAVPSVPLRSRNLTLAALIKNKINFYFSADMPRTCSFPANRREVGIAWDGGHVLSFFACKCFLAMDRSCFNRI